MNELSPQPPIQSTAAPQTGFWQWLTTPGPRQWFLPLSGLWILGLDWLLFPEDVMTLGLATPLVGLLLGGIGTYLFQRRLAGDNQLNSWIKALVAGGVVGVPFPLAGTVVGGWILAVSGLANVKRFLNRR